MTKAEGVCSLIRVVEDHLMFFFPIEYVMAEVISVGAGSSLWVSCLIHGAAVLDK